jgi:hypothetical protein
VRRRAGRSAGSASSGAGSSDAITIGYVVVILLAIALMRNGIAGLTG